MSEYMTSIDTIPFAPFPGHTPVICKFRTGRAMEQPHLPLPQPLPVHNLPDLPSQSAHYEAANPINTSICLGHLNEALEQSLKPNSALNEAEKNSALNKADW
eukprot:408870-Amphidinium_carterae.1